jgi:hypothetical protein
MVNVKDMFELAPDKEAYYQMLAEKITKFKRNSTRRRIIE